MKEIPTQLFHKACLEVIDRLKGPLDGILCKENHPLDSKQCSITASGKKLQIKFDHHLSAESLELMNKRRPIKKLTFKSKEFEDIILNETFLSTYTPPTFTGQVYSHQTINFSKKRKSFFKLIIPLTRKLNFYHTIEQAIFTSDLGTCSSNATTATIAGVEIIACVIENRKTKEKFLSIESSIKLPFESFSNKAHSVRNAIGYLTGFLAGNTAYYFAFSKANETVPSNFFVTAIRNEIISGYSPVNSNPAAWVNQLESKQAKWRKTLREISQAEFSGLSQRLHDNLEFTSLILLILESSIASLLFMPGGFAIGLEMISDIILGVNNEGLKPIPDKSINRKIRKELLAVLDHHKISMSKHALGIFTTRINNLNQVTNMSRLKAPFQVLDIELLAEDLAILKTRNDFLHGRVPDILNLGVGRSLSRVNQDLYYSSLRLYTLLNMVILKWIGYDNYVINFPKVKEYYCKIKLKEDYFRKV